MTATNSQPFTIKPGKVFICGPITDLSAAERAYYKTETHLRSLQIDSINVFAYFDSKGMAGALKRVVMFLADCNTLVTIEEWTTCEFAKKLVDIARLMGIEIIPVTTLPPFKPHYANK